MSHALSDLITLHTQIDSTSMEANIRKSTLSVAPADIPIMESCKFASCKR